MPPRRRARRLSKATLSASALAAAGDRRAAAGRRPLAAAIDALLGEALAPGRLAAHRHARDLVDPHRDARLLRHAGEVHRFAPARPDVHGAEQRAALRDDAE